jgi:hypothetical protein
LVRSSATFFSFKSSQARRHEVVRLGDLRYLRRKSAGRALGHDRVGQLPLQEQHLELRIADVPAQGVDIEGSIAHAPGSSSLAIPARRRDFVAPGPTFGDERKGPE